MRRALFLTFAWLCGTAAADDWPEIMGPKRRGISKETGWNTDWFAKEPPVLWRAKVGTGASSCAVAGGRLYTMGASESGTESVICLDAASGTEIWRKMYECAFEKRMWDGGTATTPVLDGDRLYTLSFRGQLFCWNAADGSKIWEINLEANFKGAMPFWGWAGSPLIVGNMLVVEPGGNGSSRAAVDKLTGKLFWQSGTDPAAYASPVIFSGPAMRGVALFNANALVGINPRDGTELFRHEWKTPNDVNAAIPLHRDGQFFIGSGYEKGVALISPKSGVAWKSTNIMLQFQSPVLHSDHIYLVSGQSHSQGRLQCLEWATGHEKWAHPVSGDRGQIIIAAGKLIVATEKGEVILADANPAAYKELGRTQPLPARVWAAPAFSDRRLFLRNNAGTLVCLDLNP